jgi:hypothetical protein
MLIECIVIRSAKQAQNGEYLTSKRYEIVTKSDVNWLTVPGAAHATRLQMQDLPLGQRIATNRGAAVDRTYHCEQYIWMASSKAIQFLRKDVN